MTEASTIEFELVSPERKLVSEAVKMAVIPGEAGEFGVGAGHAALVSSLRPGVLKLYKAEGASPQRIFIAGGFADVTNTNCTVLAEEAIDVRDLKPGELEQTIRDLQEDLGLVVESADRARIERNLAMAKIKLKAAAG